jgi:hypothetical protein
MRRSRKLIIFLVAALICIACGSAPFRVQPRVEVPRENISGVATGGALELRAQVLNEDEAVQLFDGNLYLAGIIPVRVALTNVSQQEQSVANAQFQLSDQKGGKLRPIKAQDALARMIKYYGIRYYNVALYDDMKARFLSHSITLPQELAPERSEQGLLYFQQEKKASPLPQGLQLQLKLPKASALNVSLN